MVYVAHRERARNGTGDECQRYTGGLIDHMKAMQGVLNEHRMKRLLAVHDDL